MHLGGNFLTGETMNKKRYCLIIIIVIIITITCFVFVLFRFFNCRIFVSDRRYVFRIVYIFCSFVFTKGSCQD